MNIVVCKKEFSLNEKSSISRQVSRAIIIMFMLPLSILAQDLKVTSFKKDIMMTDAIKNPVKDYNGDLCGLIRMGFVSPDAQFEGDIVSAKYQDGEWFIYMTKGAYWITIKTTEYTPLRYEFEPIESSVVYIMNISKPESVDIELIRDIAEGNTTYQAIKYKIWNRKYKEALELYEEIIEDVPIAAFDYADHLLSGDLGSVDTTTALVILTDLSCYGYIRYHIAYVYNFLKSQPPSGTTPGNVTHTNAIKEIAHNKLFSIRLPNTSEYRTNLLVAKGMAEGGVGDYVSCEKYLKQAVTSNITECFYAYHPCFVLGMFYFYIDIYEDYEKEIYSFESAGVSDSAAIECYKLARGKRGYNDKAAYWLSKFYDENHKGAAFFDTISGITAMPYSLSYVLFNLYEYGVLNTMIDTIKAAKYAINDIKNDKVGWPDELIRSGIYCFDNKKYSQSLTYFSKLLIEHMYLENEDRNKILSYIGKIYDRGGYGVSKNTALASKITKITKQLKNNPDLKLKYITNGKYVTDIWME